MPAAVSATRVCTSFDRLSYGNQNDSLYFTDQEWAGGLGFAYWNAGVRQFLIDNALSFLAEYHADGFRYDEVKRDR
jgi:1,4-alpha-glucan branching enzyme